MILTYSSFGICLKVNSDDSLSQKRISPTPLSDGNKGFGLLKWKGVVLDAETEREQIEESNDLRNEEARHENPISFFRLSAGRKLFTHLS